MLFQEPAPALAPENIIFYTCYNNYECTIFAICYKCAELENLMATLLYVNVQLYRQIGIFFYFAWTGITMDSVGSAFPQCPDPTKVACIYERKSA